MPAPTVVTADGFAARGGWATGGTDSRPLDRMAVIGTASVPGCVVYPGAFRGKPENDGDLEHIRGQFLEAHLLAANRGFLLIA